MLFPLKIPTSLIGVINLICRFSSISVLSAKEGRGCADFIFQFIVVHMKIKYYENGQLVHTKLNRLEKILKIKKRLVGGDENLQIIWWPLPDKVTVVEGNSVHHSILCRITPQHCNP